VKLESKRDKTVAADDSGSLTVMEDQKKAALF